MNLREWCINYLRLYKSNNIKLSTMEGYLVCVNRIPGNLPVNCDAIDLQNFVIDMHNSGLSAVSIKHTLTVIRQAIKKAYQLRMIDSLPVFDSIEYPRDRARKVSALSPDELERLGVILNRYDRYNDCFLFLLYTGMRVGEMLGLKWSDVDLKRRYCTIVRTNYRGTLQDPKTINSIRSVPLIVDAAEILRRRRRILTGDFVFPYSYFTLRDAFRRVCAAAGIAPRGVHVLRHTYATCALRSGIDIKTLSAILGHASVSITLDIYCDVELLDKQKEADKISFFSRTFQPSSRSAVSALGKEERFAPHGEPGLKRLR